MGEKIEEQHLKKARILLTPGLVFSLVKCYTIITLHLSMSWENTNK